MSEQILLQGKFLGVEEFLLSPAGDDEAIGDLLSGRAAAHSSCWCCLTKHAVRRRNSLAPPPATWIASAAAICNCFGASRKISAIGAWYGSGSTNRCSAGAARRWLAPAVMRSAPTSSGSRRRRVDISPG